MIISLKQKIFASSMVLVAIVGIGLYTNTVHTNKPSAELEMRYIADFSDDRNVLGISGHVFVGKITNIIKHTDVQGILVTLFEAKIVQNIKGDLKGSVVVLQVAGYREVEGGRVFSSLGGNSLMKLGETYLLATSYDELVTKQEGLDVYTIGNHSNFTKLLSSNETLTISDLKSVADKDEKVSAWKEAYKNENMQMRDFIENNVKNSK